MFVNIWAEPKGQAWSYQAAYNLVLRLRARTRIALDPHWFRHSAATRWLRDGVPIEVVSTLLGHSSVAVTSSVYGHLTAEDARAALEKAGWLTREGGVVVTGGWITQAGPGPVAAAGRSRTGRHLGRAPGHSGDRMDRHRVRRSPVQGQVLAPATGRRGLFGEWRQALGLDEVTETPSAGGATVYLHARGIRGGVAVSVTATVFDGEEDSR